RPVRGGAGHPQPDPSDRTIATQAPNHPPILPASTSRRGTQPARASRVSKRTTSALSLGRWHSGECPGRPWGLEGIGGGSIRPFPVTAGWLMTCRAVRVVRRDPARQTANRMVLTPHLIVSFA